MRKIMIIALIIVWIISITSCSRQLPEKYRPGNSIESKSSNKVNVETALDLPKRYEPDVATQNGDIVDVHGKTSNLQRLGLFISNTNREVKDTVRITTYTIEGDAIISVLNYDGQRIEYIMDTTRDNWGTKKILRTIGEQIRIESKTLKHDDGTQEKVKIYYLIGCQEEPKNQEIFVVRE